jgi:hypothetical protein
MTQILMDFTTKAQRHEDDPDQPLCLRALVVEAPAFVVRRSSFVGG